MAARAGLTQAAISRLESGDRLPRLETLLALAEATDHVLELRLKRPAKAALEVHSVAVEPRGPKASENRRPAPVFFASNEGVRQKKPAEAGFREGKPEVP